LFATCAWSSVGLRDALRRAGPEDNRNDHGSTDASNAKTIIQSHTNNSNKYNIGTGHDDQVFSRIMKQKLQVAQLEAGQFQRRAHRHEEDLSTTKRSSFECCYRLLLILLLVLVLQIRQCNGDNDCSNRKNWFEASLPLKDIAADMNYQKCRRN
jgi:hypothetical protein